MAEFDFAAVRLSGLEEAIPVKKLLTTVPVRKPHRQEFFRVHPGEDYSFPTQALNWQEDSQFYILTQDLWPEYAEHLRPVALRLACNRQGILFLIPCPLPSPDGRQIQWHISLRDAVSRAEERWLRMSANMSLGSYDLAVAKGDLPEPTWPIEPMSHLMNLAFKDRIVQDRDHPVLKNLRGE